MVSLLQIDGAGVRAMLSMEECIELMARAMRALSEAKFEAPARRVSPIDGGHFFLMPGSMSGGPVFGAKLASLVPGNPSRGLPAVQGFVALFDHRSGTPLALVDAAAITYLRTAATSALATRILAREDARSHGIFGAGCLAWEHLQAIASIRPLAETRVWARDAGRARDFAAKASAKTGMNVVACSPGETASCDIVTTVTHASDPVLRGDWLRPGCHVNLVGAHRPDHREADSDVVAEAAIYVDSLEGALREAGDLLIPIGEGRLAPSGIRGELGAVAGGAVDGRRSPSERTLFKSLGHVAQDLYAADAVYRKALADR